MADEQFAKTHANLTMEIFKLECELEEARRRLNDFHADARESDVWRGRKREFRRMAEQLKTQVDEARTALLTARAARRELLANFYNCPPGSIVTHNGNLYQVVKVRSPSKVDKPWLEARKKTKNGWHLTSTLIRGDWEKDGDTDES